MVVVLTYHFLPVVFPFRIQERNVSLVLVITADMLLSTLDLFLSCGHCDFN